jgi:hypothetical protein
MNDMPFGVANATSAVMIAIHREIEEAAGLVFLNGSSGWDNSSLIMAWLDLVNTRDRAAWRVTGAQWWALASSVIDTLEEHCDEKEIQPNRRT